MKQVTINIYKFSELSEKAKCKALDNFEAYTDFIYDDAHDTVKKFCDEFYIRTGSRSWLDYSSNKFDDPINELSGVRLRTWLINNYGHLFTEGKPYGKWIKPGTYQRRSKIIFQQHTCPLTGVWYDEDILHPLREFIKKPDSSTLPDLFNDSFETLRSSIDSEIEYRHSDEAKQEDIEANDYEFNEDGSRY
jgi:hypothetical protein